MRVILIGLLAIFFMLPIAPASASTTIRANITTYDYWNNSPPGYGIEYPKSDDYPTVHNWACCRNGGTYTNPITFASAPNELKPGTRIYIPYFKRYFIKEDLCSGCRGAWFDLWVGGVSFSDNQSQSPHNIVNMARDETVIINPPRGEPVSTSLFWEFRI